ncbi:Heterochromatin-associated protein MENT, partial [Nosema granulosis]
KEKNYKEVFKRYQEWFDVQTKGLLKTSLDLDDFKVSQRIYSSIIYYKGSWKNKFDIKKTKDDVFKLKKKGKTVRRKFMNNTEFYKFKTVATKKIKYNIVALPYSKEEVSTDNKRVMVYLIPETRNVKSTDLWESFYEHSGGNIKETLFECVRTKINLYIPKIEKLTSTFDTCDILYGIFKEKSSLYVKSTMQTYLNVDEEGTEAVSAMTTIYTDGICTNKPSVITLKANVPHIAFIFDMDAERITNIINYNGKE